jgi:hypothetical protein
MPACLDEQVGGDGVACEVVRNWGEDLGRFQVVDGGAD